MSDPFVIAGRTFRSRLIVGTGKYPSHAVMRAAHEASGADMATVAVRRVDITRQTESLLDYIDTDELLEITPTSLRIRKKILDPTLRKRAMISRKNS